MKSLPLTQQKKNTANLSRKDMNRTVTLRKTVTTKSSSPLVKKMKRYTKQGVKSMLLSSWFHSTCKIVSVAVIVIGTLYSSYLYIGKTFANEVVVSQSEIVSRVGKLTQLPQEVPDEIVRVQDPEDLKKQNPFYRDIEEGDYILMYKSVAVIYNLRDNRIVGVKRIQNQ